MHPTIHPLSAVPAQFVNMSQAEQCTHSRATSPLSAAGQIAGMHTFGTCPAPHLCTEDIPICDLAAQNLPVFLLLYNKLAGGQAALKIQPLRTFSHVYEQNKCFQVWRYSFFFQFCVTGCSDRSDWSVCLGHTQVSRGRERVALGGEGLGRS